MTRWILAALSLCCTCLSAHAEGLYSRHYISCMDSSGDATTEMHDCLVDEHARQDARLNDAYRNLTAHVTGDRRKALLAAQRLWIQYRDANCKVYAYPDGGVAAEIHEASCRLEMTVQRANELENLFSA
mgnify:CR=1 FL=1